MRFILYDDIHPLINLIDIHVRFLMFHERFSKGIKFSLIHIVYPSIDDISILRHFSFRCLNHIYFSLS